MVTLPAKTMEDPLREALDSNDEKSIRKVSLDSGLKLIMCIWIAPGMRSCPVTSATCSVLQPTFSFSEEGSERQVPQAYQEQNYFW